MSSDSGAGSHVDPQLQAEVQRLWNERDRWVQQRYLMLSEAGSGAFGSVHRAWDNNARRVVALKLANKVDERSLVRFTREVSSLVRLRHPNIATVFDVGEQQGRPFLVMEFLPGESLDAVARQKRVSLEDAARWIAALAQAAQHAHEQGILHRDIKPGNVIFDREGRPCLLDFGLAALAGDSRITRDGRALGTPAYMSPEQAQGRHSQVDARSDVYSLGSTLFDLLTGEAPFTAGSVTELIGKLVQEPARPPSSLNPAVDSTLDAICQRCLAKDPAARYESALALAEDLERYLAGEPTEAEAPATRRGSLVGVLIALVVALGGGLGIAPWAMASRQQPAAPKSGSGADSDQNAAGPVEPEGPPLAERLASALGNSGPWEGLDSELREVLLEGDPQELNSADRLACARLALRRGRLRRVLDFTAEAGGSSGGLTAGLIRATALERLGRARDARGLLRSLPERDSGPEGQLAAALWARLKGDPDAARRQLQDALEAAPTDPLLLIEQVQTTLDLGRDPREDLGRAERHAPGSVTLSALRALVLVRQGGPRGPAADELEQALSQGQSRAGAEAPELLRARAEVRLRQGEHAGARADLAVLAEAKGAWGLILEALLAPLEGDDPESLFARAHELEAPRYARWILRLPAPARVAAAAPLEERRRELALTHLQPDWSWPSPTAQAALAARGQGTGIPPAARGALARALRLAASGAPESEVTAPLEEALRRAGANPSQPLLLEGVRLYAGRDRFQDARQLIERLTPAQGAPPAEARRWEAEMLLRQGRREEAAAAFEELGQAYPSQADGLCALAEARCWASEPDGEAAEELAKQALALEPGHAPSYLALAAARLLQGRPADGLSAIDQALALQGTLNTRLVMLRALCLSRLLLGQRPPPEDAVTHSLAEFEAVHALSSGASARLLAVPIAWLAPDGGDRASRYLREALAQEPERGEIHLLLADDSLRQGASSGVILAHLRDGLERGAKPNPDLRARLERVLEPADLEGLELE